MVTTFFRATVVLKTLYKDALQIKKNFLKYIAELPGQQVCRSKRCLMNSTTGFPQMALAHRRKRGCKDLAS